MAENLLALPDGHRLEEYGIVRLLGAGGFGITYLAFDSNLEKTVAIKEYLPVELAVRHGMSVMPTSTDGRESFAWGLERFLDEARVLARFKHPNIVQVYRFFQAHGTAYIVMEYAEGETLARRLKHRRRLPEPELRQILLPILDGLAAVHGTNLLHRDIKPGNIIIRDDGTPVLLDFGAARHAVGARSRSVTTIVTPGYAPIEQYSSKGNQGPWTDIYALGAIAYRCASGEAPPDATERVLRDSLVPLSARTPSDYSPAFVRAVDRALAVREEDRPASIEQWRAAMDAPASALRRTDSDTVVRPVRANISRPAEEAFRIDPSERLVRQRAPEPPSSKAGVVAGVAALAALGAGAYWWAQQYGWALPDWASRQVAPVDPRQQADALEAEVQTLLQSVEGSAPALERQLADVREHRMQLAERAAASTSDVERRAAETELFSAQQREERLEDEIRLVQRWARRDTELTAAPDRLASAREQIAGLDYAAAAETLEGMRDQLTAMEQVRGDIGKALDARTRFRVASFEANTLLGAQSLAMLEDEPDVTLADNDAALALERGDFIGAKDAFAAAETRVRETATARVDQEVESLKRVAAAALDTRDAPTARRAIDRAKQLVELREQF